VTLITSSHFKQPRVVPADPKKPLDLAKSRAGNWQDTATQFKSVAAHGAAALARHEGLVNAGDIAPLHPKVLPYIKKIQAIINALKEPGVSQAALAERRNATKLGG